MEKYTRNARFCLICNYVSKIIPALQSRCTRFRFQPLPGEFVKGRLEYICQQERCGRAARKSVRAPYSAEQRQDCQGWQRSLFFTKKCLLPALCPCSIKVTQGGLEALIELGCGDMRRTLNLLQSTAMSAGEVTGDSGEGSKSTCTVQK